MKHLLTTTILAGALAATPFAAFAETSETDAETGMQSQAGGDIQAQIQEIDDLDEVTNVRVVELSGSAGAQTGADAGASTSTQRGSSAGAEGGMDRDASGGVTAEADGEVAEELGLRDEEDGTSAGTSAGASGQADTTAGATSGTTSGNGSATGSASDMTTGSASGSTTGSTTGSASDSPTGSAGTTTGSATGTGSAAGSSGELADLHQAIEDNENLASELEERDVEVQDVVGVDVQETSVVVYVRRS